MTDQDSPGFTVVDRRRAAQETSEVTQETPSEAPTEAQSETEPSAPDGSAEASTPNVEADQEATGEEAYTLPDPTLLLSMAAMQMDARTFVAALMPLFDSLAWRALGLIADPKTGEPNKDLPAAQLAIDCVEFFMKKVEGNLSEAERRDVQRRLSDLRMNYLAKLREA